MFGFISKKILVFEPWNLGDLVISAIFADALADRYGKKVSFLCSPAWSGWLRSLSFVSQVLEFRAPWTDRRQKYNPFRYDLHAIYNLRTAIKGLEFDLAWDVRGDIRHYAFLKSIYRGPVVSISYPGNINVYNRLSFFESKVFQPVVAKDSDGIKPVLKAGPVSLFIDSDWHNKRLPHEKAQAIIEYLLSQGHDVQLIVPPKGRYNFGMNYGDSPHFHMVTGSVSYVAEAISRSSLLITTDSSWMHMAYYYRVPIIALFGFENYVQWAPPNSKVVTARHILPAKERYKLKNEFLQPLSSLCVRDVTAAVEETYASWGNGKKHL